LVPTCIHENCAMQPVTDEGAAYKIMRLIFAAVLAYWPLGQVHP
jgi:hypothetical protein